MIAVHAALKKATSNANTQVDRRRRLRGDYSGLTVWWVGDLKRATQTRLLTRSKHSSLPLPPQHTGSRRVGVVPRRPAAK